VMNAGGLGACGALLMEPDEIAAWADEVRANGKGPYQLNLWIPDPPPTRRLDGYDARRRLGRGSPQAHYVPRYSLPKAGANCDRLLHDQEVVGAGRTPSM